MKTFAKLFAVLAFLAVGFTACSNDDEGDVTIKLDYTTVDLGNAVTGTITSTNSLATVTLTTDGKTVTGWPITSFKTGAVVESSGVYTIRIEGLEAGSYIIRATDKDGVEDSKTFTVKGGIDPNPEETGLTTAADFTLGRPSATGFPESAMGLTWASNVNTTTAKFTGTFVIIDELLYTRIKTVEDIADIYNLGEEITEFTAQSDANFAVKYLIIKDGTILRLVKMTNLTFAEGANKAYFTEKH